MKVRNSRFLLVAVTLAILTGCGSVITKEQAYPAMYDSGKQPLSILVVPAINESTAADAADYYAVTISEPLSYAGYYVYPIEVITDILRSEGVADSQLIRDLPATVFKDGFGADAVLFVTITGWEKNYIVIAGNVTIGLEYVMLSTETNEVLWDYSSQVVVDTSGNTGFILTDIIATAVTTAITKYVDVAKRANSQALVALPFGSYNKSHGMDGALKVVNSQAKDASLDP